jgi:hypothetical protein
MTTEDLLLCLVHVIGRAAIPVEEVQEVVGSGRNRIKAFNMFDGTRTLSQVARATKIDQGNLSRAVTDWIEHGIAFWVGQANDSRLLHVYPVPPTKKAKKK